MKKSYLIVILLFFVGHFSMAQSCLEDAKYALVELKQIPRAKTYIDECFAGNESSAEAWLVRANVYLLFYDYERDRLSKNPKYELKAPDALIIANESFYRSRELNPDLKASRGLYDAKDGQLVSAEPMSDLATQAKKNENYAEAIKLLNLVIRSYRASPNYATFLAYAYLDLADSYKAMGDMENYKKTLLEAAKINIPLPDIYLNLYDIYKQENDTIKAGEILQQARKAVSNELATDIKGYELDYFAMIGDTTKLKESALKLYEEYKTNPTVIVMVATYLINNKEYTLAEEILTAGLAIAPDNFDLNQQMTYRFFYEAIDWDKITEELKSARKFTPALEALNKANEILESALIWAEKAYHIKQDDKLHNIMYRQILVRLQKEVPEDLKTKVDSYYQH